LVKGCGSRRYGGNGNLDSGFSKEQHGQNARLTLERRSKNPTKQQLPVTVAGRDYRDDQPEPVLAVGSVIVLWGSGSAMQPGPLLHRTSRRSLRLQVPGFLVWWSVDGSPPSLNAGSCRNGEIGSYLSDL
jgi:hypothetical protein